MQRVQQHPHGPPSSPLLDPHASLITFPEWENRKALPDSPALVPALVPEMARLSSADVDHCESIDSISTDRHTSRSQDAGTHDCTPLTSHASPEGIGANRNLRLPGNHASTVACQALDPVLQAARDGIRMVNRSFPGVRVEAPVLANTIAFLTSIQLEADKIIGKASSDFGLTSDGRVPLLTSTSFVIPTSAPTELLLSRTSSPSSGTHQSSTSLQDAYAPYTSCYEDLQTDNGLDDRPDSTEASQHIKRQISSPTILSTSGDRARKFLRLEVAVPTLHSVLMSRASARAANSSSRRIERATDVSKSLRGSRRKRISLLPTTRPLVRPRKRARSTGTRFVVLSDDEDSGDVSDTSVASSTESSTIPPSHTILDGLVRAVALGLRNPRPSPVAYKESFSYARGDGDYDPKTTYEKNPIEGIVDQSTPTSPGKHDVESCEKLCSDMEMETLAYPDMEIDERSDSVIYESGQARTRNDTNVEAFLGQTSMDHRNRSCEDIGGLRTSVVNGVRHDDHEPEAASLVNSRRPDDGRAVQSSVFVSTRFDWDGLLTFEGNLPIVFHGAERDVNEANLDHVLDSSQVWQNYPALAGQQLSIPEMRAVSLDDRVVFTPVFMRNGLL
ncbi:hypothetical protein FISHEDRAFT_76738 [Fistulina hepatica ATCC 64428]|uniref:Uncharacterized protein n=1 Tax=Fistulina hepatica ATCC 64428 TaxID=1128425 RepID=A0A0D7A5Q0_9AGAR|nr:hypothetical protein FISHEDRAFT_76738 [Fistulina hepatica ATCC 64428]